MSKDCVCFRERHDETMDKVNRMAETFSVAIIIGILDENLCPYAAKVLAGKILAVVSARILLADIGPEESAKLEGLNLLQVPEVRHILETIHIHAQNETESKEGKPC